MRISIFLLLFIFFTNTTFANKVRTVKLSKIAMKHTAALRRTPVICKQKNIPLTIEQTLDASLLTVKFIADQKISKFSLKSVRGIDGVTVLNFQELLNQKLGNGESVESTVELGNFTGLVYVVFDVSVTFNGATMVQSIPVPLGELSEAQLSERSKNIIQLKNKAQHKTGVGELSAPAKKIHEMKLE